MKYWFALQIDRDFYNGTYGDGIRLYIDSTLNYKIITGVSYENDILKVKDSEDNIITLENEPDNNMFENTIYVDWKLFDSPYIENRSDYEPWAYASKKSLAIDLKICKEETIEKFFNKSFS
jgi:hypothetical protein